MRLDAHPMCSGLTKRQRTQSVKGDKVWVGHKQVENVRRLTRGNR